MYCGQPFRLYVMLCVLTLADNPEQPNSLLRALMSQYRWHLLVAVPPRLCLSAFTFAQPFLVSRILDYVVEPDTVNTKNIGYGLVGAMGIVYTGLAVCYITFLAT